MTSSFRLFGPDAVGAATFIGGPIPGGITMLINDFKTGRPLRGLIWLIGACAVFGVVVLLSKTVGSSASAVNLGVAFAAYTLAKKVFRQELAALQTAEIKPRSAGAGGLVGLPFLLIAVAMLLTGGHEGDKTQFGDVGVYVRDGATVSEAEAVAAFFAHIGEVDLYIDREDGVFVVGMVMQDAWYETESSEQVGVRNANLLSARMLDGEATVFIATDDQFRPVERYPSDARFGRGLLWGDNDWVYARSEITDEQLTAAQAALDESAWVREDGVLVRLYSSEPGTIRACVLIAPDNLERPEIDASIAALVATIPGAKGADICNQFGDVVRAAE